MLHTLYPLSFLCSRLVQRAGASETQQALKVAADIMQAHAERLRASGALGQLGGSPQEAARILAAQVEAGLETAAQGLAVRQGEGV